MKKGIILSYFCLLFSCNTTEKKQANTSMDVGRDFIRTTLDGDFEAAEKLLLKDSLNVQMFASYKNYYASLANDTKEGYKKASYIINSFDDKQGDSLAVINYSNSYMQKPMNIKIVKSNDVWVVDFKYTSSDSSILK
jgi:hypothetical protein